VPIVAERDGHDYIAAAVAAGAPAYLTARPPSASPAAAIVVADTAAALLAAGGLARARITGPIVGVTGSVGKTTVKDLTAAALASLGPVAASERSFNNELGVPLTLLNAPDGTAAAVIEMGARGAGHIALLCGVARPTVGIVTAVALAHTELFGSIEAVAAAKGELVEALPATGTAVLNADDPNVAAMAGRTAAHVVTYGRDGGDVRAEDVRFDDEVRPAFALASPWGRVEIALPIHGVHQVSNALAAAAAALAAGAPLAGVAAGLSRAQLSPWRMDLQRAASGGWVLNDAYNANPASMEAALRSLAALPATRRIAVLGLMAELGPAGAGEHRRVGDLARELGIEVVAVGDVDYGTAPVRDADAARAAVGPVPEGTAVLVKASRVAGLEALALALLGS
jgi:UDP-N-acetylmuramoyl-tripeptide--D-alanyl-D-alanine ligase